MSAGRDVVVQLVTDERVPFDRLLEVVAAAVDAGVGVVQLRAKQADARELLGQARAIAEVVAGRAALVVNDRVDVAWAAREAGVRVDGVHLGQDDLPADAARRLLGPDALIGWTADRAAHLAALAALPPGTIDYLGVGVIHATTTKPDHPPVLGVAGFARIARATSLPCVAIGGVTAADVPALRAAGAAGVAVVSAICAAPDPGRAARALVRAATGASTVGAR